MRNLIAGLLVVPLVAACSAPAPGASPSDDAASAAPSAQLAPTLAPEAPRPATALALTGAPATAPVYSRVELTINTDVVFANPFDPAEADLRVVFSGPDGLELTAPAFWYQAYDPATLAPLGEPGWRVRFTPPTPGPWQARAELARPALQSAPIAFSVTPDPAARGFVGRDPANPRYFAFTNGAPYVPIGPNIAWAASLETTIPQYEDWLGELSANGGSVARVWMASWSVGIEWQDTGLGDYSARLRQAYLLDEIFRIAEERDIYLMLCLLNHGAFSTSTNPEWDGNPYNLANGGMLAEPGAFVTDPAARELFKRRLRYIAARWGASTHLFAWEWWNEVNWTPIGDAELFPWIEEMTAHLRRYDPYGHLVSSSYATGGDSGLWALPEIDFAQQHDYSGGDPVRLTRDGYAAFGAVAPDKPLLLAEHGLSAGGADDQYGRERIHFHNGIWAPIFLGYAGSGMAWWWDSYIDPNGLWSEYKPLADFIAGERLAELAPRKAGAGSPWVDAVALQGEARALVWVRNRAYDAQEASLARSKAVREQSAGPDWVYEPPERAGLTLTVAGLADGAYTAHWYDPQAGAWLESAEAASSGGTLAVPIPTFSRDLALKLLPVGEPRTAGGP